jgi:hypothetical protein
VASRKKASPPQPRSRHFRRKAAECLYLAETAHYPDTKRIYTDLAYGYEKLASHADQIEEHHEECKRLLRRDTGR